MVAALFAIGREALRPRPRVLEAVYRRDSHTKAGDGTIGALATAFRSHATIKPLIEAEGPTRHSQVRR
jgi:hypothetical protein